MMPDTSKNPAPKKADPATKDAFMQKIETMGKDYDAQLILWRAKADKGTPEVKAEFYKWHKDFGEKRVGAQKKIDAMRAATPDAFEHGKADVETAWNDIKSRYETAKKRYA